MKKLLSLLKKLLGYEIGGPDSSRYAVGCDVAEGHESYSAIIPPIDPILHTQQAYWHTLMSQSVVAVAPADGTATVEEEELAAIYASDWMVFEDHFIRHCNGRAVRAEIKFNFATSAYSFEFRYCHFPTQLHRLKPVPDAMRKLLTRKWIEAQMTR